MFYVFQSGGVRTNHKPLVLSFVKLAFFAVIAMLLVVSHVSAQNHSDSELSEAGFTTYVNKLKQEALQKGFSEDIFSEAFGDIHFRPTVVKSDKNQPEKKITLDGYLATRVPDWKVKQAVSLSPTRRCLQVQ